jgi:hypothetical protein
MPPFNAKCPYNLPQKKEIDKEKRQENTIK